jgi:hypothetical protein
LTGSSDAVVLDRELAFARSFFTHDSNFLAETHCRQLTCESFAGVVFSRQMRISIGKCVADLELIGRVMDP